MLRTHYTVELNETFNGKNVTLAGWIQDTRIHGSIAFLILRDGKGTVQITLEKKKDEQLFKNITSLSRESVLLVEGVVKKTALVKAGLEIIPMKIEILNKAEAPLPLGVIDKVPAMLDTRLDNRFIDLRKHQHLAIFNLRTILVAGIREYLFENGFLEINTPKIVSAGAEGGATLFELNYFGRTAYLAQSPQLYKQMMMATGADKVFEIAPAFRAEPSDTVRHLSEFTSLDIEIAYIKNSHDVMDVAENLSIAGLKKVKEFGKKELEFFDVNITIPESRIPRIPHADCLEILNSLGKKCPNDDIDTEGEKMLGEYSLKNYKSEFFFITEFPTRLKRGTFYAMRNDANPALTGYFDLLYKGQELVSGGQREHRYERLLAQITENNMNPDSFKFYLDSFKYGMPPHGGFGLGVERFVQKMLNLSNIREAILFPRDRIRVTP